MAKLSTGRKIDPLIQPHLDLLQHILGSILFLPNKQDLWRGKIQPFYLKTTALQWSVGYKNYDFGIHKALTPYSQPILLKIFAHKCEIKRLCAWVSSLLHLDFTIFRQHRAEKEIKTYTNNIKCNYFILNGIKWFLNLCKFNHSLSTLKVSIPCSNICN